MLVSSSPERIVGNYVLHRLCVPRYPPLALCSLTISDMIITWTFYDFLVFMQFSRYLTGLNSPSSLPYSTSLVRLGAELD